MRLATVGTSFITDHFIQAIQKEGSFELTTIFSRTPDKAKVLSDKYKVPFIQSDWKALLQDPNLEVIYIATPNDTHYGLAKDVLEAKKHVILEKPFASHSRELDRLLKIAKASDRYVFDAIIPMHLPNFKALKEALPLVGTMRMANLSMVQRSSRYASLEAGEEPAIFSLAHSGGALMDLGVYPTTLLVGLFGKPQDVNYVAQKYTNGIDVSGVLTFTYPGFVAAAVVAKDSTGINFMTFSGDKGHLLIDKAPSLISSILFVEKDKSTELGTQQDPASMVYEIKDFYEVITQHDDARYTQWMDVTRTVFEVMDKCREKANLVFAADGEN